MTAARLCRRAPQETGMTTRFQNSSRATTGGVHALDPISRVAGPS
jgi:hypothetical protein